MAAHNTCDALIVGGGPAGLSAAIALRQQGLDVVLADALIPPIDKACGEGLMPDAVRELARLGIVLDIGHDFSGISFVEGDRVASATFAHGKGIGIRRIDLHARLIDRAQEIGVRLKWGGRVALGVWEVTVGGEVYRYRYLIGADGEASRVRRWAGLEHGTLSSQRLGFRRHYRIAPWSESVEVHWCERGQVYITPVADSEICVAAITRQRGMHFDGILEGLPYLRGRLDGGRAAGRDRGSVTTTRRLRRVIQNNIALVGDASGSSDAITGTGLALAFQGALLLGNTVGRDAIADYQAGHARISRMPQAMASILLAMDRRPLWRKRIIAALGGSPELFARLLAVHTGEEGVAHFAAKHGLELILRLLFPEAPHAARPRLASHAAKEGCGLVLPELSLLDAAAPGPQMTSA